MSTAGKCPCGCVLVMVPTCGGCGESFVGQREAVLLDASKAKRVPCAENLKRDGSQICARDAGHSGDCSLTRSET